MLTYFSRRWCKLLLLMLNKSVNVGGAVAMGNFKFAFHGSTEMVSLTLKFLSLLPRSFSWGEEWISPASPTSSRNKRVKMGKQIFQGASFISSDIKSCRLMRKESEWANGNNKVKIVGRVATTRHICYRYRSAASAGMNKGGSLLPSYVGSNQKHGNWTWVQLLFSHSWYTCPKPLIQDLVAIFRSFFIPSLK